MRPITPGQLARYQLFQESTMHDRCLIYTRSDGVDRYDRTTAIYTPAAEKTICGYDPTGGEEVQGSAEVEITDAALRLPVGTAVKSDDGIELTDRLGSPMAPTLKFYIMGPPEIGPSGIVLKLRNALDSKF